MYMFEVELASRGGAPLFQPFHILKAMWCIQQSELIGRKELSAKLAIGEGTTRKLLSYMERKGWAISARQGISLTNEGQAMMGELGISAAEVEAGNLTVGEQDFAVCLRQSAWLIGNGILQRDEAMKAGASGASTLIFQNGLKFSDGYDANSVDEKASQLLVSAFGLKDGDVIIIGSSLDMAMAQDGAFAAAVLTLDSNDSGQ